MAGRRELAAVCRVIRAQRVIDIVAPADVREPAAGEPGLAPKLQDVIRWMARAARDLGLAPPIVISTCRSRQQQDQMRERWDRGDREGMAYRPAEQSWHIPGQDGMCYAVDFGNTREWLSIIGPLAENRYIGLEWGGHWLPPDYAHIQWPPGREVVIRIR